MLSPMPSRIGPIEYRAVTTPPSTSGSSPGPRTFDATRLIGGRVRLASRVRAHSRMPSGYSSGGVRAARYSNRSVPSASRTWRAATTASWMTLHPLDRIGHVGADRQHQVVDVVAAVVTLPATGSRPVPRPPGRPSGSSPRRDQIAAERAAAHGEEHVVERRTGGLLGRQQVGQRQGGHGEAPPGVE